MSLKEQLSLITKNKNDCDSIIRNINERLFNLAKDSYISLQIYKLEAKNDNHRGSLAYVVVDSEINFTDRDWYIVSYYRSQGLCVTFTSVNLNPYPEVGEEGYKAAYYMNLSWK